MRERCEFLQGMLHNYYESARMSQDAMQVRINELEALNTPQPATAPAAPAVVADAPTDEQVKRAINAWFSEGINGFENRMRAALSAGGSAS